MTEPWFIAVISQAVLLLVSLWAVSVRMTWKAGETKAEIISAITKHAIEDENEFGNVRREIYKAVHDFGETIMALKEHTNAIQLEAARLYVRRDGFQESMKSLSDGISAIRSEFNNNIANLRGDLRDDLKRMELKIDSKT
jgi:hypothetical protein